MGANALLGVNQGLTWSMTVIMKIDLVGPRRRGLAMGLNEFAAYLAVALAALGTGFIAEAYGLRPAPFYLGIAVAAAGFALSLLFVRETRHHAALEAKDFQPHPGAEGDGADLSTGEVFAHTSWKDFRALECQPGRARQQPDAWGRHGEWSTRRCSPRSAMWRIRTGAARRQASIASGGIAAMRSARFWLEPLPIVSG